MEFEFDENKSKYNKEKHGIDFLEARQLWNDLKRVQIPAKSIGELRFLLLAVLNNVHWSAIFTVRRK